MKELQRQATLEIVRGPLDTQVKTNKCILVRELPQIGERTT